LLAPLIEVTLKDFENSYSLITRILDPVKIRKTTKSYKERIYASPSLKGRQSELTPAIIEIVRCMGVAYRYIAIGGLVVPGFILAILAIAFSKDSSTFYYAANLEILLVYGTSRISLYMILRKRQEGMAAILLLEAILVMESRADDWRNTAFRWGLAQQLERIALAVERIPLGLRSLAPDVKSEVFRKSSAKAQAIRELELWAIQPQELTFTDLLGRLTFNLCIITESRWYDLPESARGLKVRRSWWPIAIRIGGVIMLVGAIIAVAGYAKVLGGTAPLLSLVCASVIAGILNSAGLSASLIDQYVKTGQEIASNK
jgi:hypothetical protein